MTGPLAAGTIVPAESTIQIGNHVTGTIFGLTVNLDTIWSTAIAGAIVIGLGFWMRSKVNSEVPSKIQIFWESIIKEVTTQVEANLGKVNPFVVPLAVALFLFILFANWLELIPSGEDPKLLPAPTADINLTLAMALLVIISVWVFGIREKGAKNYFKHFIEPYPALLPLNIIEEITKSITLCLRLFGNILAGGVMIALLASLPFFALWAPTVVWKLFDMFIGAIQAFIFALLTVLYFGAASGHGDEHGEEHADQDEAQASPSLTSDADGAGQESPAREPEPAGAR
ncbi:MAG: F0F1 ATP synthase subunit A [Nocardioidaceae bacterium]